MIEFITKYAVIRIYGASALMIFGFFFDVLQRDELIALLALIVIDFITAVYASLKNGEMIKSSKVARTAIKISFYFLMVSAGFLAEKAIPLGLIDDAIIAFLAATELISILENTSKAGFAIPKKVIDKLHEFVA